MADKFDAIAGKAAAIAGNYLTFIAALLIVLLWAVAGPFFKFSETWQLVINTGTTIVTFLMVFLIQNTQNRDSEALHVKLDELLNAIADADNSLMEAEDDTARQLKELKAKYRKLAEAKGTTGTVDA